MRFSVCRSTPPSAWHTARFLKRLPIVRPGQAERPRGRSQIDLQWRNGLRIRAAFISRGAWLPADSPGALQVLIEVPQAGELAHEGSIPGRTRRTSSREIAASEKIGLRDYGAAHRPVLISALRPRQLLVHPEVEAHAAMLARGLERGHLMRQVELEPDPIDLLNRFEEFRLLQLP